MVETYPTVARSFTKRSWRVPALPGVTCYVVAHSTDSSAACSSTVCVAFLLLGAFRSRELAEGVVRCVGGQRRVEAHEGIADAFGEHRVVVVPSFGGRHAGRDVGAMSDLPAGISQPGQGRLLDHRFGEGAACVQGRAPRVRGRWRSISSTEA